MDKTVETDWKDVELAEAMQFWRGEKKDRGERRHSHSPLSVPGSPPPEEEEGDKLGPDWKGMDKTVETEKLEELRKKWRMSETESLEELRKKLKQLKELKEKLDSSSSSLSDPASTGEKEEDKLGSDWKGVDKTVEMEELEELRKQLKELKEKLDSPSSCLSDPASAGEKEGDQLSGDEEPEKSELVPGLLSKGLRMAGELGRSEDCDKAKAAAAVKILDEAATAMRELGWGEMEEAEESQNRSLHEQILGLKQQLREKDTKLFEANLKILSLAKENLDLMKRERAKAKEKLRREKIQRTRAERRLHRACETLKEELAALHPEGL